MKLKLAGLLGAFMLGQLLAAESYAVGSCGVLPVPPAGCTSYCQCDSSGFNCEVVTLCQF